MAKVKEKPASKKVADQKKPQPKVEPKVEPKKELTFEEKVKKNEEFQEKKRGLKSEIEQKKKEIAADNTASKAAKVLSLSVLESKLKDVQTEERQWLESFAKMLDAEIKKNGFLYKFVKRGKKSLIYSQHSKREEGEGFEDEPCCYEVFLSRISAPKIAFKKPYDAYEMFPGNSVFGIWAWAPSTLERAEARFMFLETGEILEAETSETEDEDETSED